MAELSMTCCVDSGATSDALRRNFLESSRRAGDCLAQNHLRGFNSPFHFIFALSDLVELQVELRWRLHWLERC